MSDVDERIAVGPVLALEFLERRPQVGELRAVPFNIGLELADLSFIELDNPAPADPPGNELEVGRALRQEREQGHTRPEIHGDQAGPRIGIARGPFHGVGLALEGPPFILPGEL